jgi:hypothetical protein
MLTPKEKKKLTRLEEDLTMPRWKFIVYNGLSFGILLAIVSFAIEIWIQKVPMDEWFRKRFWYNMAAIPVSGFFYARIVHWLYVKKYLQLKQKEKLDG